MQNELSGVQCPTVLIVRREVFMLRRVLLLLWLIWLPLAVQAQLPELDPQKVQTKVNEILKAHAVYKELSPTLMRRILTGYIEQLDPSKTYFIKTDIVRWIAPDDALVQKNLENYKKGDFSAFEAMNSKLQEAVIRRRGLEKSIVDKDLPTKVDPKEFKDLEWAENTDQLTDRLKKLRTLQREVVQKLQPDLKEKAFERIAKSQAKQEDRTLDKDPVKMKRTVYSNFLKAFAASLDAHSVYFTPDEALTFLMSVQQRMFGIGAQLRDDISGFTVIKIIEGGPAGRDGQLKVKDRIIAVNGEPVVGMDIQDAVELIRGKEGTTVSLKVVREEDGPDDKPKKEQVLDLIVPRGEVVLKDTRYESNVEPYGNGVIAYLRLHTFYQDPEFSSASDLTNELNKLKEKYKIKGVVLDLRSNTGGLLTQAVDVAGLFITKGVIVSIKDEHGRLQHLRDLDGKTVWDGPLIVLVNKGSASASEIVAQSLQDYGRALVVGDANTYGKGSFQTFTLNATSEGDVSKEGEYTVTRGRYYTVSGKTPQLKGVTADLVVPGGLSQLDIGEEHLKYPLLQDSITANFDDQLSDVPLLQRERVRQLYKFDLQPKLDIYSKYMDQLRKNSEIRIAQNKSYQAFLKELDKKDKEIEEESFEQFGQNDLQLIETYNIMKDLVYLMQ